MLPVRLTFTLSSWSAVSKTVHCVKPGAEKKFRFSSLIFLPYFRTYFLSTCLRDEKSCHVGYRKLTHLSTNMFHGTNFIVQWSNQPLKNVTRRAMEMHFSCQGKVRSALLFSQRNFFVQLFKSSTKTEIFFVQLQKFTSKSQALKAVKLSAPTQFVWRMKQIVQPFWGMHKLTGNERGLMKFLLLCSLFDRVIP